MCIRPRYFTLYMLYSVAESAFKVRYQGTYKRSTYVLINVRYLTHRVHDFKITLLSLGTSMEVYYLLLGTTTEYIIVD